MNRRRAAPFNLLAVSVNNCKSYVSQFHFADLPDTVFTLTLLHLAGEFIFWDSLRTPSSLFMGQTQFDSTN